MLSAPDCTHGQEGGHISPRHATGGLGESSASDKVGFAAIHSLGSQLSRALVCVDGVIGSQAVFSTNISCGLHFWELKSQLHFLPLQALWKTKGRRVWYHFPASSRMGGWPSWGTK